MTFDILEANVLFTQLHLFDNFSYELLCRFHVALGTKFLKQYSDTYTYIIYFELVILTIKKI